MNIVYTTNDNFIPQISASICSVYENNKDMQDVNVIVISDGVSNTNKKQLQEFASKYKRELGIIELGQLEDYFDFEFDTNGWNQVVLARLLLDKLLPDHIERIIYLDGDTIVLDSLKDLWQTDLQGAVIGAAPEPTVDSNRKNSLGMQNLTYCNAGVLLIDLKRWREDKVGEHIINFYKDNNGNLFANDQDAINGALKEKIYILSPRYNYFNIYDYYPHKMLKKLMDPVEFISQREYRKVLAKPAIIHYLGEERPWRKGNKHKYRNEYLRYLSLTPWKDTPMEEGWTLYFFCLGVLNFVTRPVPIVRYKIINALIPSFMKIRSKKVKKKS